MRQVIKHRDIRLLKMIRKTDPVIPYLAVPDKSPFEIHKKVRIQLNNS